MQKLKNLLPAAAVLVALLFSSCLHIVEEATFHNNGSGSYKMTIDMSALKGFMDMAKNMGGNEAKPAADSAGVSDGGDYTPPADTAAAAGNPMSGLGDEISGVASSLKGLPGITNVVDVKDTSNFSFGYSFDFANMEALNRALKIVNKEKFQSQNDGETFKFDGKHFERLGTGDIGSEMKKAMSESSGDEEGAESQMDMMKMFLADMSYKQIYHFPDRKVKKSSNKLSQLSDDNHTMTLTLLPFDEEQQKHKASVATKIKLK